MHETTMVFYDNEKEFKLLLKMGKESNYFDTFENIHNDIYGLVLKKENKFMYENSNNGIKYAYKANVKDVDWNKTCLESDVVSILSATTDNTFEEFDDDISSENIMKFLKENNVFNCKKVALVDVHI